MLPFTVKLVRVAGAKVQTDENPLDAGHVSNELAKWQRQSPHQGWQGENLITLCKLRVFHQIDDRNAVAASKVLITELLEPAKGGDRFQSRPGDVEPQIPFSWFWERRFSFAGSRHRFQDFPLMSFWRVRLALALTTSPCRLRPIATLSWARDASRCLSWLTMRAIVAASGENPARNVAICPSSAARLDSSANCCRSASSPRLTCSASSRASCAIRADPVSIPLGPI